jgi:hypothetical protein
MCNSDDQETVLPIRLNIISCGNRVMRLLAGRVQLDVCYDNTSRCYLFFCILLYKRQRRSNDIRNN